MDIRGNRPLLQIRVPCLAPRVFVAFIHTGFKPNGVKTLCDPSTVESESGSHESEIPSTRALHHCRCERLERAN